MRKNNKGGADVSLSQRARSNSEYQSRESGRNWRDKSKVRYFNCGAYGHYAAECKKPRRDKDQKEEVNMVQMQDDEPALLMTEFEENNEKVMLLNEDKSWTRTLQGTNFGDGSVMHIKGKGSVILCCKNGGERILREVNYIPTLCNNIISLGQMSEEGNKVILNGEYLWVYDKENLLLMKVKRSMNRLYKIIIDSRKSSCLLSKCDEISWFWHSRLGHVNFKAMSLMSSNQMVRG
ncbi:uncharacterized protein LOC141702553 [Apium graveolens]|uniref:uncharacterized protein LOC141702553 n=1 Tax=Apium graveolens TaxID=4045 RepID=UPI003D792E9D